MCLTSLYSFTLVFIFSGIGEDNMFRLTHWIATGLFLTSYFFNKNKNDEISKKI